MLILKKYNSILNAFLVIGMFFLVNLINKQFVQTIHKQIFMTTAILIAVVLGIVRFQVMEKKGNTPDYKSAYYGILIAFVTCLIFVIFQMK